MSVKLSRTQMLKLGLQRPVREVAPPKSEREAYEEELKQKEIEWVEKAKVMAELEREALRAAPPPVKRYRDDGAAVASSSSYHYGWKSDVKHEDGDYDNMAAPPPPCHPGAVPLPVHRYLQPPSSVFVKREEDDGATSDPPGDRSVMGRALDQL